MKPHKSLVCMLALAAFVAPAQTQELKSIRTSKGKAVALTNLIPLKPDCSIGLMDIPTIVTRPEHGALQQGVVTVNLPAHQNCPTKAAAVITIVYAPASNFVGSDATTIQMPVGGHPQSYSFNITVAAE